MALRCIAGARLAASSKEKGRCFLPTIVSGSLQLEINRAPVYWLLWHQQWSWWDSDFSVSEAVCWHRLMSCISIAACLNTYFTTESECATIIFYFQTFHFINMEILFPAEVQTGTRSHRKSLVTQFLELISSKQIPSKLIVLLYMSFW